MNHQEKQIEELNWYQEIQEFYNNFPRDLYQKRSQEDAYADFFFNTILCDI